MKKVSKVSRALAAAALATAGLVAGASAASAHTTTVDSVIAINGEWKAYATLNTGTGILCVRAYHSVPDATAYAAVRAGSSGEYDDDSGTAGGAPAFRSSTNGRATTAAVTPARCTRARAT